MNVSVIIPAFNAAETIAETLQSLLAQSDPGWEAIVVDDGSRDATAEIVEEFVRRDARILLLRQSNAAEAAARNAGLDSAHHEWLHFLDSDDWIAPAFIERMTHELIADPELHAVHCGYARVAPDGTVVVEQYQPPAGDVFHMGTTFRIPGSRLRRSQVTGRRRWEIRHVAEKICGLGSGSGVHAQARALARLEKSSPTIGCGPEPRRSRRGKC